MHCVLLVQANISESKNCLLLLATPTMRLWTLIMDLAWFTAGLIYFALALNTGSLYGSPYLNTFLSGAMEVPAYVVCVLLMRWKWTGRRWTGVIGLVGAAAASFTCIAMIRHGQSHLLLHRAAPRGDAISIPIPTPYP